LIRVIKFLNILSMEYLESISLICFKKIGKANVLGIPLPQLILSYSR